MVSLAQLLVVLHVVANVVWIGALASIGLVLTAGHGSSRDRGAIAVRLYRWLATPAFLVSLGMGLWRLLGALDFYFVQTKFMHGKLLAAVGVIALHHVLGSLAKRMASGRAQAAPHATQLVIAMLFCAAATIYFAVGKPF